MDSTFFHSSDLISNSRHVVMFLANAFGPDPRVEREACALVKHGYQVTTICWDREAQLPPREVRKGFEVMRVHNVLSTYGSGWRQLFYIPRFWHEAIRLASPLQPNVVHCHDLDTLYAGWQLKRRLGCSLVYDAHEHYPALMSLYLPTVFVRALAQWERWLMSQVDATITASTVLRDEFLARGIRPVVALGNHPDIAPFMAVREREVAAVRARLGVSPGDFLVAYIGGFSRNRMLLPLIEAAAGLPQVCFHLWGDGLQRAAIEQAVACHPNVWYHGWLPSAELPSCFRAADVIYYCLRPDYHGAIYNAPNTLSQAMAAGRPIIANDVGDLGRIVRQTECGILLPDVTPDAIRQAILVLSNPAVRRQLGEAGRSAAEARYNWTVGERNLVEIYTYLTGKGELITE
jgi:glycosyltransferase involved in cell wall biosynthesis